MIIDKNTPNTGVEILDKNTTGEIMVAENKDLEENKDNILFQPTMSSSTNVAVQIDSTSSNIDMKETTYSTENIDTKHILATEIRCCMCGGMMPPNKSNTCINCLKAQVDITEGISKTVQL